jgi:hypothetical protein
MQSVHITTNIVSSNPLRRGVLDTTLCDKVCQWLTAGQWFSLGTSFFQPIKLAWPPWYKLNIVESGVKHHTA